jgi:excinuclease ABC subunit C
LAKQFEHIIVEDQAEPIVLLPTSPVLHLVQHLRDEAHRFAITHHRARRGKGALRSALDTLPGIGPARRTALLKRFGTLSRIRQASPAAIADAANISLSHATSIVAQLKQA